MSPKPPEGLGSRDRILWAAASMLGDDPGAALSVRAVAARAEVSTGSLRHHFPTQRALLDETLAIVYDMVLPDADLHDTSIPPRDRLLSFLRGLLGPADAASHREAWVTVIDRYVRGEPGADAQAEYVALERELRRRVEGCLAILQAEGALPDDDNPRRARFLLTVVNGLSAAAALPADESRLQTETEVLESAVDAVFARRNDPA